MELHEVGMEKIMEMMMECAESEPLMEGCDGLSEVISEYSLIDDEAMLGSDLEMVTAGVSSKTSMSRTWDRIQDMMGKA